jgi:putative two-component system response regulator
MTVSNREPFREKASTILVVDDEESNVRLLDAMLKSRGYEVTAARNGAEALERARRASPDLILMDVMMPVMDGFEATRRLRADEETMLVPIVMVTALHDVEARVKALDVGADDFLTKPVDRMEPRARVRSLLKVKAYNDHMKNYRRELEAEVTRRTEELRRAYGKITKASPETIHRLSRAAEYKDSDTGSHILRMSNISALVARGLELNETVVDAFFEILGEAIAVRERFSEEGESRLIKMTGLSPRMNGV